MVVHELLRAAQTQREVVRRRYFDEDGRRHTVPRQQARQPAVRDVIAARFGPGPHDLEVEVNRELIGIHENHATQRHAVIDVGLMDHADGRYWRSGGTAKF